MKTEQQTGKHGEQLARSYLSGLGLEMIEHVGTPVHLSKLPANWLASFVPAHVRTSIFRVIFGEKVAADWRAMLPDGTSVLIEVKTIYDRNLVWSDLRDHQPGKLQEHADFNGLSLLVWVNHHGPHVMRWPVDGFKSGKGITPEQAVKHHAETVRYITARIEACKEKSL